MRSRHSVDQTVQFVNDAPQDEEKWIEDAEAELTEHKQVRLVKREPYRADKALEESVNVAIALGRPLLLQGDPGCGKTRLAYAVAYALGLPLEECYIKSTSQAQDLLYQYDAVNRLYDAQLGKDQPLDALGQPRSKDVANYIHLGPLGRAIARADQYKRRSVVLIDEIDKANLDFPNDLLLELDRLEFRVSEKPTMHWAVPEDRPELRPIVFVTHNEEKALPGPFLRRCVYHFVEFPKTEKELLDILALHDLDQNATLGRRAIEVLVELRQQEELTRKPGLAELLDWVGYLQAVKVPEGQLAELPYVGALVKEHIDQERARERLRKK